ncbi:TetR/AcrR family transcriptional regulator [Roseibium sp. HPY-6]|uniref:TetR/AcrR family transcriptional regulator n=1 Tax=Roseibium sp. HPY-6 TaxID=3229852 RepID=UPI00338E5E30
MSKTRLGKADWIQAGMRALAASGVGAVRAEALARTLRTTKGSFYWHFKDINDFQRQILDGWQASQADEIIRRMADHEPGIDRLRALVGLTSELRSADVSVKAELAIREWARLDTEAAKRVAHVDAKRLDYLNEQFQVLGFNDRHFALDLYTTYLGLRMLKSTTDLDAAGHLEFVLSRLLKR